MAPAVANLLKYKGLFVERQVILYDSPLSLNRRARSSPIKSRASVYHLLTYGSPVTGGAEGGRTPDLLNAIQAFSQLNYGPSLFVTLSAGINRTGRLSFKELLDFPNRFGLISNGISRKVAKYRKKKPGQIYPGSFPSQVEFRDRSG